MTLFPPFIRGAFTRCSCFHKRFTMNRKIPRLLLFDIDGTLVTSHYKDPVGANPVAQALSAVFRKDIKRNSVLFAGGTDRSIIRDLLRSHGITEENTSDYEEKVKETLDIMPEFMRRGISERMHHWTALPNVHELLIKLSQLKYVQLGLLTGNIIEDARIKLESASVDISLFEVDSRNCGTKELLGAFGSDHEIRSKLVPIAQERYSNFIGEDVTLADMIVIGDSPKDISCAHDNGVACVAVGTGPTSPDMLSDADCLLRDGFRDVEESVKAIVGTCFKS